MTTEILFDFQVYFIVHNTDWIVQRQKQQLFSQNKSITFASIDIATPLSITQLISVLPKSCLFLCLVSSLLCITCRKYNYTPVYIFM